MPDPQEEAIDGIIAEMRAAGALSYEGTVRGALADAWRLGAQSAAFSRVPPEQQGLRQALEKIVEWDDAEKPHKNLPLLDCAELARRALAARPSVQQPSEPTDEEVEAAGRVIFELTVGPGHSWDTIEGPGRDLWRRNTRAVLRAALCAARKAGQ